MTGLSAVLKQRRKELGLTLAQIADMMGVAEATVQRWESGNIKSIRHDKIAKLAEVLNVNPASLMGWQSTSEETTSRNISGATTNSTASLTEKDERDIAKDLEAIMDNLEHVDGLMFDGNPMSDEARESMRAAIELGLKTVKLLNKETYTPKKYKKG